MKLRVRISQRSRRSAAAYEVERVDFAAQPHMKHHAWLRNAANIGPGGQIAAVAAAAAPDERFTRENTGSPIGNGHGAWARAEKWLRRSRRRKFQFAPLHVL